jgi:predicted Ser/Thr protein kinase
METSETLQIDFKDGELACNLLGRLGFLVLQQVSDQWFRIVGVAPNWFYTFFPTNYNVPGLLEIGNIFPFLEIFILDPDSWQPSRGSVQMGPWSEVNTAGREYNLEAVALYICEKNLLVVRALGAEYEEKQAILQELRNKNLDDTRKIREMRAEVLAQKNSPEHLVGQLIVNRYQLEDLVGQGGLGAVYRAGDLQTGRTVAVKMLLEQEADEEGLKFYQKLFEREIKILRRVKHPNIVAILDAGVTDTGRNFLVMEFLEGRTLGNILEEDRVWSVERVLNLLRQICPALQTMHDENIIHRDLKPANIMICEENGKEVVKLLDLGIAKLVHGASESSLLKSITRTGVILGTIQYLAPEQCMESELDERVDMYALGTIVYEMLSGNLPLYADTINGWFIAHIMKEEVRPLTVINPLIGEEVDKLVRSTLAKRREDRPVSMLEFLARFEQAARWQKY